MALEFSYSNKNRHPFNLKIAFATEFIRASSFKEISADVFTDKNRTSGLKKNLLKFHPKTQHPLFENANRNNGTIFDDDCAEINKNIR